MQIPIEYAFIVAVAFLVTAFLFLVVGYGMGRNSCGLPVNAAPRMPDQGSTAEPPGDLFNDLMRDDDEVSISTLKR
jgi:hypothetical protein